MLMKKLTLTAALGFGGVISAQAADTAHNLDFKSAVERAVADGTLDGSVKFYLAGTKSGGNVVQKDAVTNKKPMVLLNLQKQPVITYYVLH